MNLGRFNVRGLLFATVKRPPAILNLIHNVNKLKGGAGVLKIWRVVGLTALSLVLGGGAWASSSGFVPEFASEKKKRKLKFVISIVVQIKRFNHRQKN